MIEEKGRQESENAYRTLAENIPGIVYRVFVRENNRIQFFNDVLQSLTGYTPGELKIGEVCSIDPLIVANDREKVIRTVKAAITNRQPFEVEYRLKRKDGSIRYCIEHGRAIPAPDGDTSYIDGVIFDITERRRMEEEIRDLARFPSENPNPILRLDRHGSILSANEASKALLQDWGSGIGQVAPKFWRDLATDALSTGQSRNIDIEFGKRSYTFLVKPVMEADYVNLYGRDITERKRTEEALRESEDRLRRMTDNMLDIVVETDLQGICKYASASSKAILGYDPKDLVGRSLFDFVYPEDLATVTAMIQRAVSTGLLWTSGRFECRYRHADGHYVWLENLANIIYDEKGRMIGGVIGARDITERKRMQDELRRYSTQLEGLVLERTRKLAESERRFRELADLLPQIVFEIDENGNFTFLNRVALASTGYSKEDIKAGLNALELYSPQDRERRIENVKRLMAGEMLSSNEYLLQRKDRSTFPAIVHFAPIVHENKIVGQRGIAIDITERKQMEEELRSARARLEHVISDNPAVIYTARPRPNFSDFDPTFMSRSVVSLTGLEPEAFINHPEVWHDRVHPEDLNRYFAEMPLLWRQGQHTFEFRFLYKDGTRRWIREEARVIRDASGKPVEVLGYWSDITGERQVEEMRDRFMSAVTHELRTPLVSIMGYLDVVLAGESGPIPSEVKSNLEVVKRNTDRLTSLTDDLLDIQRLQSGKLQVNLKPIDLREIIRHAASEIKPFTKAKRQRFKVAVSKKPLPILGDPVRLSQVLMNLLSNASKFTPEGGEIRLTVKDAKEMIVVKVADTGIGIRKEDLPRVFEPFAAIKKPAHIKGTGLGLSVTKGLVEGHTGKIWAESPGEGKGSSFVFALLKRVVK
jgi:PAS domain S-box-containing protein